MKTTAIFYFLLVLFLGVGAWAYASPAAQAYFYSGDMSTHWQDYLMPKGGYTDRQAVALAGVLLIVAAFALVSWIAELFRDRSVDETIEERKRAARRRYYRRKKLRRLQAKQVRHGGHGVSVG